MIQTKIKKNNYIDVKAQRENINSYRIFEINMVKEMMLDYLKSKRKISLKKVRRAGLKIYLMGLEIRSSWIYSLE